MIISDTFHWQIQYFSTNNKIIYKKDWENNLFSYYERYFMLFYSSHMNLDQANHIEYELYLKGLTEENIRKISADLGEPERMLQHRLKSLEVFHQLEMPKFWPEISDLNFNELVYYAKPKTWSPTYVNDRDQVPAEIKQTFQRLGIPEAEQKYLAGAGGQFDSTAVYHKIKEIRAKQGVIFEDMKEAVIKYPDLIQKYFMKTVPINDHKFAALHGAVWSGGSFVYVPKGVKLTQPLQAYFRMNTLAGGQFEHTLIIIEDEAEAQYIEGCSAPKYNKLSLHAGCVEISVGKHAKMRYSSVENWSLNTYNLNTKRAIVEEHGLMEWIGGNLGSGATMLYPCSVLKGDYSKSDNLSVVMASKGQNQDVGAKVIHLGKYTTSNIISKSISTQWGISTYRGLVKIGKNATGALAGINCDALILDEKSISKTIPVIESENADAIVSHEASAGKVDENQIFYLMSRGLEEEKAMSLLVNGFISGVVKQLPLEYAGELNRLIELEMEGSVG